MLRTGFCGVHAHINLRQLLVALNGSFDIVLKDGIPEKTITVNKPNFGLLITNGIWRELQNFSFGSVCLGLASGEFDEDDYIRAFNEFENSKL